MIGAKAKVVLSVTTLNLGEQLYSLEKITSIVQLEGKNVLTNLANLLGILVCVLLLQILIGLRLYFFASHRNRTRAFFGFSLRRVLVRRPVGFGSRGWRACAPAG